MWLRTLCETRERYAQQPLPKPMHDIARTSWKIGIKPILKIVTVVLAKTNGFIFPRVWKWKWEFKRDMLLGLYEKETVALCHRMIKPGMTALDIGAHIGYFTRLFSTLVGTGGKVYAFEPHPENFCLLQTNTSRFVNVFLSNKAISDANGIDHFFMSNANSGSHSLFHSVVMLRNHMASPSLERELITLDTFWEESGRPSIDFIKMDIEGAEPRALRGAQQLLRHNKKLTLITEFCPANLRAGGTEPEEFLDLLSGFGFRWAAIGKEGELLPELPKLEGGQCVNLCCEKS
jgi:FkbM family methyltransferase